MTSSTLRAGSPASIAAPILASILFCAAPLNAQETAPAEQIRASLAQNQTLRAHALAPTPARRVDVRLDARFAPPAQMYVPIEEKPLNAALRLKAFVLSPVTWFGAAALALGFVVAGLRRSVARRRFISGSTSRVLGVAARPDFGRQAVTGGARRRVVGDLFPLEDAP